MICLLRGEKKKTKLNTEKDKQGTEMNEFIKKCK